MPKASKSNGERAQNLILAIRPHRLPERVLDVRAHGVRLRGCQELHRSGERFVRWRWCASFQLKDMRVLEAQDHYA